MVTTINVKGETRMRLNRKKYDLEAKSLDETINRVLDIIEKMEALE